MQMCYSGGCHTVKRPGKYCDYTVRGSGIVNAYKAYLYVKTTEKDTDGDGVLDSIDMCPDTFGTFCNGCPEPTCSGCQAPSCSGEGLEPVCVDDNSLCAAANVFGTCTDGECSFVCDTGFGNCNYDWIDGCETDLNSDQGNCGTCGSVCQEIACTQQDGCGVGNCNGDEYGFFPSVQQQTCIQGTCEGECVPVCEYDQTCDQDDDDDGVPDSDDACPQTFGDDCNGCPNPCTGCGVMVCDQGSGNAPSCLPVDDLCADTECPDNGCGVGTCGTNEFGTYSPSSSKCVLVNGNNGICDERDCSLTCEYNVMCEPNVMHIESIEMTTLVNWLRWPPNSERRRGVATIKVVNAIGDPVEKALVKTHWSGLPLDKDSAWTNSEGLAKIYSNWIRNPSGDFVITVDDISKTGWTYDFGSNTETSDSITV